MSSPLDKAADRLGEVCRNRFRLRATIPASENDDDVVIARGIGWAKERIAELQADYEKAVSDWYGELKERRDQVDQLQQLIDQCIVAAGSGGLMATDLPKRIAELRRADRKPRPKPPNLAGMSLAEAAKARMALGDGSFADINCLVQAMREEVADCANYQIADTRVNGEAPAHREIASKLVGLWSDLRELEAQRKSEKDEPNADDWQPIETAPKDGRAVLLADKDGDLEICKWREEDRHWATTWSGGEFVRPAHWRPLPKPPAREGD